MTMIKTKSFVFEHSDMIVNRFRVSLNVLVTDISLYNEKKEYRWHI